MSAFLKADDDAPHNRRKPDDPDLKRVGEGSESEFVHQRRLWLVSEHYRALKSKIIAFF